MLASSVAYAEPRGRAPLTSSYSSLPQKSRISTAVDTSTRIYLLVFVKLRNYDELKNGLRQGRSRSAADLEANFYPTLADYQKLRRWLESQGLDTIEAGTEHHRQFTQVVGTVADVANALQTKFCQVSLDGSEKSHIAACTEPTLPAEIAPMVQHIDGLQPFRQTVKVEQRVVQ